MEQRLVGDRQLLPEAVDEPLPIGVIAAPDVLDQQLQVFKLTFGRSDLDGRKPGRVWSPYSRGAKFQ